jgi:hypothetical protein
VEVSEISFMPLLLYTQGNRIKEAEWASELVWMLWRREKPYF